MDRYQVVTLQAAVYVVDNDEMQASRFAGDWNAHASCELLNSGAMPRTDLDWIDLDWIDLDPTLESDDLSPSGPASQLERGINAPSRDHADGSSER